MTGAFTTPSFEGLKALLLHREHANTEALERQFARIGVRVTRVWPELEPGLGFGDFDILLFDADMGYDGQFAWAPGEAPMPTIALIGSEAPGRVSWAAAHGADAQMLKPIGSSGAYSALVIATHAFARRKALEQKVETLIGRLNNRERLAEAVAVLMVRHGLSASAAYNRLRRSAMEARVTMDDAALRILDETGAGEEKSSGL
ncbi:ANTAR domain-containing response regulator [Gellertiella hungarica]|uniref:AmiR/NasT family two-component response regulator n=1 Tax=Gellertiella hungarica TaxID=1572859 RepID=A0A7W6NJ32_9HYPH|nr:ANTAR domain-containing protein [Gellertiella hungarica]MBB4062887.1 AmiR/NasT family two-component response regulator [Gellertiella hungarica]